MNPTDLGLFFFGFLGFIFLLIQVRSVCQFVRRIAVPVGMDLPLLALLSFCSAFTFGASGWQAYFGVFCLVSLQYVLIGMVANRIDAASNSKAVSD